MVDVDSRESIVATDTAFVPFEFQQEVLQVMRSLTADGMTMVVVTHEMAFARDVGTRLLFIEKGHIIVDDNPRTVLANPEHPRLRDFLAHVA